VEVDVADFVVVDAGKDAAEHLVADAGGQRGVEPHCDQLGDEEHQHLGSQPEDATRPLEDAIGPV